MGKQICLLILLLCTTCWVVNNYNGKVVMLFVWCHFTLPW